MSHFHNETAMIVSISLFSQCCSKEFVTFVKEIDIVSHSLTTVLKRFMKTLDRCDSH